METREREGEQRRIKKEKNKETATRGEPGGGGGGTYRYGETWGGSRKRRQRQQCGVCAFEPVRRTYIRVAHIPARPLLGVQRAGDAALSGDGTRASAYLDTRGSNRRAARASPWEDASNTGLTCELVCVSRRSPSPCAGNKQQQLLQC